VEIKELAVKVASQASMAIPLPGAAAVIEALLRELLQIQDQQTEMLAKIEADVQRLVDGPWCTGRRYLREATLPGRSAHQISEALLRALEYFRQAVDLQPGSTFKRATVSLDLAMLCALTGDAELAAHYATESEAEARQALDNSARAAWKKQYGARNELRVMAAGLAPELAVALGMKKLLEDSENLSMQADQYRAYREAAAALGADLPRDVPSIEPESKEFWSARIERQAKELIIRKINEAIGKKPDQGKD
jgi:hypothetical protein